MLAFRQRQQVDPKLPSYKVVEGISGRITSIGADPMNQLMTLWAQGFRKLYPGVEFAIEGKG